MTKLYDICPLCGGGLYRIGVRIGCPLCDMEDTAFPKVRKFKDTSPDGKKKRWKREFSQYKRDFGG